MNSKEILKDLVSFNTFNDQENSRIINYLETYLKKLGFETEYKSKCLVMKTRQEAKVGFLGHTDTVYGSGWTINPFELKEVDDKLYGLGTSDMKGGIASMLAAVSKIDWKKTKYGMKLIFTYDEEIGFSGIKELIDNKIFFPECMLIGEPTYNKIINASKGLLEFKVSFSGVSCHSSTPEKGINAIENGVDFIKKLQRFYKNLKKISANKELTMNIGIINGGKSINIVPNSCNVCFDFRTTDVEQTEKIMKKISELTKTFNAKTEVTNNIKPFANKNEKVNMSDFISEASFIESGNKYILGVGPINAHIIDEFISIKSLEKLEEQYLEFIEEKCMKE